MAFTSLYSVCGAGFAFLWLLASATALPVARATSSPTLVALQFANVLEQLESTFYAQALQKFNLSDFTTAGFASPQIPLQQFQAIATDESTHADTLKSAINALGGQTIQGCTFNVSPLLTDVSTMVAAARLVENVGVSAYLGALTLINDTVLSTAAATIMTVEARHQTILNLLAGATPIPQAFDVALNPSEILALAGPLISGCNLGIPSNVPLQLNSSGPLQPGAKLNFSSAALNGSTPSQNLSCQFLAGGLPAAISQPLSQCSVPANMTGPLYVFVTSDSQPLANNIRDAATCTIVAGPAMIFVDDQQDALAMAARPGLNSTVAANGSATTTASFAPPTTITLTPAPATSSAPASAISSAPASAISSAPASAVASSATAITTTISPSQAGAIIASMSA